MVNFPAADGYPILIVLLPVMTLLSNSACGRQPFRVMREEGSDTLKGITKAGIIDNSFSIT